MTSTSDLRPSPSRRAFLVGGSAAALGLALGACSSDDPADSTSSDGDTSSPTSSPAASDARDEPTTLTAADFAALGACLLTPEQTEGPFYAGLDLVRRDITEELAGHPLRLGVRVVDEACEPLAGATVDIWHADVDGDYSAFTDGGTDDDAGEGTTFLRGSQVANDEGIVEFRTNYPGWYQGRAVHIHTKVHLDDTTVLTTQLYFPEDLTDDVHAEEPYAAHDERDTRNEDDRIAGDPGANGNLVTASADGSGTLGLVVLGVEPGDS